MWAQAILVGLVCVLYSQGMHINYLPGPGRINWSRQPVTIDSPQCFGLARRSRTQTLSLPILYNSLTGQMSPIPASLLQADAATISKIEKDGWEVRNKQVSIPMVSYDRVPVCCPWDTSCSHAKEASPATAPENVGPCAHGGQLIFRDGRQQCECPAGFKGVWCQVPDLIALVRPVQTFPTGPVIRGSNRMGGSFADMVNQAEAWKRKVMMIKRGSLTSPAGFAPWIRSQKQPLNSLMKPWARRAAMWHRQAMQAVVASMIMRQKMQAGAGNPYSFVRPQGQLPPAMSRAYNALRQAMGAAQMGNMYRATQQELSLPHPATGIHQLSQEHISGANTYSKTVPYAGMNVYPGTADNDVWSRRSHGDMLPSSSIQPYPSGRRQAITPLYVAPQNTGLRVPQARTPWDLDPFGEHQLQGPAYRNDPMSTARLNRKKQLMALAFYQYIQNQQRSKWSSQSTMTGSSSDYMPNTDMPSPIPSPPRSGIVGTEPYQEAYDQFAQGFGAPNADGVPTSSTVEDENMLQGPAQLEPMTQNSLSDNTMPQGSLMHGPMSQGPMSQGLMSQSHMSQSTMPQGPMSQGPMSQGPMSQNPMSQSPMSQGPMSQGPMSQGPMSQGPMSQGPMSHGSMSHGPMMQGPMSQGQRPPMEGMGGGERKMPTPEEMAKIEECRMTLEPRMDTCLSAHSLTMEQFMNPDYMAVAQHVCQDSSAVGQCLMSHDKVCGDGEQVLITRKMINSVLQMMSMVCQQIMARGETPMPEPPMESSQSPMLEGDKTAPTDPQHPIPVEETQTGDKPSVNPTKPLQESKFKSTESDHRTHSVTSDPGAATKAASKSGASHDSAHPVSREITILGYPLWLVVTVGLVLFAVICAALLLFCLCVRRRRRKQKTVDLQKEIEKIPELMDGEKLAALGMAPPVYTTTTVLQTQDDLTLPPLDLSDETTKAVEDDDDDDDKKPPLEVEDADDESDEKEDQKKSKKEKKDKK